VGGSYPETGLSDITLSWMMGKAKALGLEFADAAWAGIRIETKVDRVPGTSRLRVRAIMTETPILVVRNPENTRFRCYTRSFMQASVSRIASRISAPVFRHPWIAVVVFVLLYGVRTIDLVEFRVIAAAPFVVGLRPDNQLLYASPFTFVLAAYYLHHGLSEAAALFTVSLLGILVCFAGLTVALSGRDRADAGVAAMVMFSSPLLFVVFAWIGKSDPYLLGFFFLLTALESRLAQIVLPVLMMLCHREMAVAMLLVHLWISRREWRAIVLGMVLGQAALYVHLHFLLSTVPASRTAYAMANAGDLLHLFRAHPLWHLACTFGAFWLYVVTRRTMAFSHAAIFLAVLALSMGTYDFTRVFVITSVPLILTIAVDAASEIRTEGGILIAGHRVSMNYLWPLMFLQAQVAGAKLLWAHGFERVLG
jgi:hypothetical protein